MANLNSDGTRMGADGKPMTAPELIAIKTYHFAFDSADLLPEDKPAVIAQGHYLEKNPSKHILLAGNTDSRGSPEYNIALGWRRAQSVEDVMVLNGAKKDQIQLLSYGQEKPVAFGDSEEAYQQNRRMDLTYKN
jgi:peptidoglycan-associated lipoprotein